MMYKRIVDIGELDFSEIWGDVDYNGVLVKLLTDWETHVEVADQTRLINRTFADKYGVLELLCTIVVDLVQVLGSPTKIDPQYTRLLGAIYRLHDIDCNVHVRTAAMFVRAIQIAHVINSPKSVLDAKVRNALRVDLTNTSIKELHAATLAALLLTIGDIWAIVKRINCDYAAMKVRVNTSIVDQFLQIYKPQMSL